MDIGTNGQEVIGNGDWMVTAACSAGPARHLQHGGQRLFNREVAQATEVDRALAE